MEQEAEEAGTIAPIAVEANRIVAVVATETLTTMMEDEEVVAAEAVVEAAEETVEIPRIKETKTQIGSFTKMCSF